jgi:hypothetical protein
LRAFFKVDAASICGCALSLASHPVSKNAS